MKTAWMIVWLIAGFYFVIAGIGGGNGWTTLAAMICGFMSARNMADVVETEEKNISDANASQAQSDH